MSHKYWCDKENISVNEIDNRASKEIELGHFPTLVFISLDLLTDLQKSIATTMRYQAGHNQPAMNNVVSVVTAAGSLNVQSVRRLKNFLMVGRKEDFDAFTYQGVDPIFWNDEERIRIDKAFEDLVILTGGES